MLKTKKSIHKIQHLKFKTLLGFTLVELIVVIVILAILATIAFLSFNSYSSQSRDSVRLSDANSFSKSLELFNMKVGGYPIPDESFNITYSGGIIWYQGKLGDNLLKRLGSLSKKIVDPLDNSEYIYSKLAYGNAYQIKFNYEGDRISYYRDKYYNLDYVNASAGKPDIAYIKGNYMGVALKSITGSTICIIAVPSIVTNIIGTNGSDYNISALSGTLLYHGQSNKHGINYNPNKVVYCGTSIPNDDSGYGLTNIASGIINAYSGSDLINVSTVIKDIVNTPVSNLANLGGNIVSNISGNNVQISNITPSIYLICTAKGQTYTGSTTYSGCDTPDKIICSGSGVGQVWAMCNVGATTTVGRNSIPNPTPDNTGQIPTNRIQSVQGNYYQWGRNDDITPVGSPISTLAISGTLANNVGHSNFITTSSLDWLATQNDNLWGGATTTYTGGTYLDQNTTNQSLMQGPCASGYHVPTMKEWCNLVVSIGGGATCTAEYQSYTSTASTLKLSLAGRRNNDTANYYRQNTYGHYWTASPNGVNGHYLLISSTQIFPLNGYNRAFGFSVRCMKN